MKPHVGAHGLRPPPPLVSAELIQEAAAWKAVEHGEEALAVVDAHGALHGSIPHGACWAYCSSNTTRTSLASPAISIKAMSLARP